MLLLTLLAQMAPRTGGTKLGDQPLTGAGTIGTEVNKALTTTTGGLSGGGVVDVFTRQFSNLIGFLTVLGGVFFLVYMLIAAFEWIQSGGDAGKVEKARTKMTNGAIGLLVMIISFGIIGVIGGVFGLDLLNPGDTFLKLLAPTP